MFVNLRQSSTTAEIEQSATIPAYTHTHTHTLNHDRTHTHTHTHTLTHTHTHTHTHTYIQLITCKHVFVPKHTETIRKHTKTNTCTDKEKYNTYASSRAPAHLLPHTHSHHANTHLLPGGLVHIRQLYYACIYTHPQTHSHNINMHMPPRDLVIDDLVAAVLGKIRAHTHLHTHLPHTHTHPLSRVHTLSRDHSLTHTISHTHSPTHHKHVPAAKWFCS